MMKTSLQSPECFTLTAKELCRYQFYALTHISRLSPRVKYRQLAIFIWPACWLGLAVRGFVYLWIAGTFSPPNLIAAAIYLVASVLVALFNGAIFGGVAFWVMWLRTKHLDFHDFSCGPEMLTFYQNSKMKVIRRHEIYALTNEIGDMNIIAKDRCIIPKNAFLTDVKAQEYYQYFYNWWQKRSQTLDPPGVWPPAPHSASESIP